LAAILTSRFAHAAALSTKCLAEALQQAGYRTAYAGLWPFGGGGPAAQGFDTWIREGVEGLGEFVQRDASRPFFLHADCRGRGATAVPHVPGAVTAAISLHGRDSGSPMESSVRVRLGISGVAEGAAADLLVSQVDVMPTLLGMAGVAIPREAQGRDVSSLLAGGGGRRPESVFAHGNLGRSDEWRLVVRGLDKLVVNQAMQTTHLYNLGQDPGEENNLAAEPAHQRTRDELTAHLVHWMRRIGDRMDPSGLKVRG
jgi:arylsulfatase A-like enzyme